MNYIAIVIAIILSQNGYASDDNFNVQRGIVGKGKGNDTYIVATPIIDPNESITISDTEGYNSIQLIGNISISGSRVATDTLELTLSNNTTLTVLGASKMQYIIGGDPYSGTPGTSVSYASFASDYLGVSVQPSGINEGGNLIIGEVSDDTIESIEIKVKTAIIVKISDQSAVTFSLSDQSTGEFYITEQ